MIAQATRAVRLAAATVTTRTGLRCSNVGSRGSTEPASPSRAGSEQSCRPRAGGAGSGRPCARSDQALLAAAAVLQRCQPNEAANCRPERKRSGSLTEAASAVAETIRHRGSSPDAATGRCLDAKRAIPSPVG